MNILPEKAFVGREKLMLYILNTWQKSVKLTHSKFEFRFENVEKKTPAIFYGRISGGFHA